MPIEPQGSDVIMRSIDKIVLSWRRMTASLY